MKKTNLRLYALMLALVMALSVLVGCNNTDAPIENGGNIDTADTTDNSAAAEPIQITTQIYEIAKHGNLILYMYGTELFEKGFEHGDILEIAIAGKTWDVPLCSNYSDVDNGAVVLRASSEIDGVVLAINMGDFATTAQIAEKTVIDEDPGYRWDYLMESPVEIKITMKEEGGYREQWLIRQLFRTDDRADYAHLSDEDFANFRVIDTAGMGNGVLYRSSSPINPVHGRNTYADEAAKNAGIKTVVNFADLSNTYEGTEDTYYNTCKVVYVSLDTEYLSEATLSGIAEGMRFIINNNGPYLIHCNEGKDRAGFVSALLECLMGATIDEVIDDYMLTYFNYYGVEKGSEKYDAIVNNNLIKVLNETFKTDDVYKADLAAEAEAYLVEDAGLTADEVAALKAKLSISLQETYESGKNHLALLGDHESVYLVYTVDGKVIQEDYYNKEYMYTFYDGAHFEMESDFLTLLSAKAEYYCTDNVYMTSVSLAPSGIVGIDEYFDIVGTTDFITSEMFDDDNADIVEKDGFIIVSVSYDEEELAEMGDDVASCIESYTIDMSTREMTSVRTFYTFDDGSVMDGVVTITRDVEIPEGMKKFVEYDQQTSDMRTVTIVSNPGTENEKTESIQVPKGLQVAISADFFVEQSFEFYADSACTQTFEGEWDVNSDLTIYVKWDEAPLQ